MGRQRFFTKRERFECEAGSEFADRAHMALDCFKTEPLHDYTYLFTLELLRHLADELSQALHAMRS